MSSKFRGIPGLRTVARLAELVSAVLRHLVWPLQPFVTAPPGPVRFRKVLEAMGAAWVKLGQALALRFDLLPPSYCMELFKLLNQMQPFGYGEVRRIVEEELGESPGELFAEFEKDAFAAASIGQVHRARLSSGQKVAVKVQRPAIRPIIRTDINLMRVLAWVIDAATLLGGTHATEVVDEFAAWTLDELDYRVEARNAVRLAQNASDDSLEHNAAVAEEYSSARVLTTEYIEGISFLEIIEARRQGDEGRLRDLRRRGIDLTKLARHLMWNTLNQVYSQGFFHADLHPANLFALKGGRVGYVDFGIVGRLPEDARRSLARYAWQLFRGNPAEAADELLRWIQPTSVTNRTAARAELVQVMERYINAFRDDETQSTTLETSAQERKETEGYRRAAFTMETDVLGVIRRFGLRLDPQVVRYFKAVMTGTQVIYELDPAFDLMEVEDQFFSRMISDSVRNWLNPRWAAAALFDYSHRVRRALDAAGEVEDLRASIEAASRKLRRRIAALLGGIGVTGASLYGVWTGTEAAVEKSLRLPGWLAGASTEILATIVVLLLVRLAVDLVRDPQSELRRLQTRGLRDALRQRWKRQAGAQPSRWER